MSVSSPSPACLKQSFTLRMPEGDDHKRAVCDACGFIDYRNPKIIVGAICAWGGGDGSDPAKERILLARRAIEPRVGFWTMPAGYMEMNESTEEGAAREVWEEARAHIEIGPLLAVFNLPRIGQVHMIYRARMASANHAPGPESQETMLTRWNDIPWDALAFPTVRWSLQAHDRLRDQTGFAPLGVADMTARPGRASGL